MREDDLAGDALRPVTVRGADIVVARSGDGRVCAIAAACSHMGGPLADGMRDGDEVVCPWHGSRFDLCTGDVVHGPAVYAQPRYETRVREGVIEVRLAKGGA
jgi:nitrite reductase/ring-hydroxylating ferredoxin subunit